MDNLEYFFNIMDTRKTNRKYQNYVPPKEDIERIINSARLAPSAINAQTGNLLPYITMKLSTKWLKQYLIPMMKYCQN